MTQPRRISVPNRENPAPSLAISYQRVRERLWRTGYRDLASQCTLLALCLDAEPEALELFLMWNVALPKDIHERFSRWIAKGMPLDRSAVQHRTDRRRPWFAVGDDSNSNPRSR